MRRFVQTILMLGVVTVAAAGLADPVAAQGTELPADVGNLGAAKIIDVRDSGGKVVLRGKLVKQPEENGEIELEGKLMGGKGVKGRAEAEVEVKQVDGQLDQEVELTAIDLAPNATYSVHIDSTLVGTFQTDRLGHALLEVKTAKPAAAAAKK